MKNNRQSIKRIGCPFDIKEKSHQKTDEKKEHAFDKDKGKRKHLRRLVPGAGVEPAHHYWRQILSLLRLPISPPGQFEKHADNKTLYISYNHLIH